jgi:small subunit ribosomal protein S16
MIKIRLRRTGMKKQPHYRIVVADARAPRDGKYIDLVGHYNPLTEPATIEVDAEKAAKWIRQGAQMTETVEKLFNRAGILEQVKQKKAEQAHKAE